MDEKILNVLTEMNENMESMLEKQTDLQQELQQINENIVQLNENVLTAYNNYTSCGFYDLNMLDGQLDALQGISNAISEINSYVFDIKLNLDYNS